MPERLRGSSAELVVADDEIVVLAGGTAVARHRVVAPGEAAILDGRHGGRRHSPARAVRPRSGSERAFLALEDPVVDERLADRDPR